MTTHSHCSTVCSAHSGLPGVVHGAASDAYTEGTSGPPRRNERNEFQEVRGEADEFTAGLYVPGTIVVYVFGLQPYIALFLETTTCAAVESYTSWTFPAFEHVDTVEVEYRT